jgi:hypothetical protein
MTDGRVVNCSNGLAVCHQPQQVLLYRCVLPCPPLAACADMVHVCHVLSVASQTGQQ